MIRLNGKRLTDSLSLTYQTRLVCSDTETAVLTNIAALMSGIKRELYAAHRKGAPLASLKNATIAKHQIPARYFNAAKAELEGVIRSVLSNLERITQDHKTRLKQQRAAIKRLDQQIAQTDEPEKRQALCARRHQRQRRLGTLEQRSSQLERRLQANDPQLCFGTKKLFAQQHRLQAAGFASHAAWQAAWRKARTAQFFLVGSADESTGCQLCNLSAQQDGSYTARLRVPDALVAQHGKYLTLRGIRFAYGSEPIAAALRNNQRRRELQSQAGRQQYGELYKQYGQPLSYRFVRDDKGWRLFCTTALHMPRSTPGRRPECGTDIDAGCLGVDLNADHLAVARVDRFGNPKGKWTIPCCTYGLSRAQAQAVIGEACRKLVELATRYQVPISLESLSFTQKKAQLETENNRRYARMLSGLSYDKLKSGIVSRAFRHGVDVFAVNPAHTSTIGRTLYAAQYGYSVHHSAAVAIARRLMNCREQLPRDHVCHVWDDRAGHVALPVPADTGRHVWSRWGALRRSLTTALAGQPRRPQRPPDPRRRLTVGAMMSAPSAGASYDAPAPW